MAINFSFGLEAFSEVNVEILVLLAQTIVTFPRFGLGKTHFVLCKVKSNWTRTKLIMDIKI